MIRLMILRQLNRFKNNTSNIKEEEIVTTQLSNAVNKNSQANLIEYNKMKNIYEEERMNQQSHLYIRRIAHDKNKQLPYLIKYPLLQYLCNASKIMMLNEYEIIAWSLWLDNIKLEDDEYTVEEKILFTAFFVKVSLNPSQTLQEVFEAYFNCYMRDFIEKFNDWIDKNSYTFKPHPIEMNTKYIELSRPYNPDIEKDFIEYNHIVDDILQISPPYQTDSNYAPRYLAPDNKPQGPNTSNPSDVTNTGPLQKLSFCKNIDEKDLMPNNNYSKNSFTNDKYMIPDFKKTNSIVSITDLMNEQNASHNIEKNRQSTKGIASLINNLSNIYNIEEQEAPNQPPSFKIDSLFKNNNQGSIIMRKPEAVRPNTSLDFKRTPSGFSGKNYDISEQRSKDMEKSSNEINQAYSFLTQNLGNPSGFLKLNINDFHKDDDDDDEKELDNIPNLDNLNSRNNS